MKKCRYCGQDVPIRDHATYQDCIGILLRKIETLERQFTDWSERASQDMENVNADRWRYKKALEEISAGRWGGGVDRGGLPTPSQIAHAAIN